MNEHDICWIKNSDYDFDIELEFDSIDINKEFGFGDYSDKTI